MTAKGLYIHARVLKRVQCVSRLCVHHCACSEFLGKDPVEGKGNYATLQADYVQGVCRTTEVSIASLVRSQPEVKVQSLLSLW